MRKVFAGAMLALVLAAGPCLAQDSDTAEGRAQAALALQQAMGGDAALVQVFAGLRPTLIKLQMQTARMPLSRAADMVDQVEIPELQKHVPDMLAAKARIYAKYFTAHDLEVMTAFYRSPTGQKALANQVALSSEFMASMQPLVRDLQVRAAELAKNQAQSRSQPAPSAP